MPKGLHSQYYDPEKLSRIDNLQLLARTVVEGYISGLHRSPFKGSSVEFAEYREYMPGDDLKDLDWKVYARTNKMYVKEYEEETNMTLRILVDSSGSMSYAGDGISKGDYAFYLAAALTYLGIQQRDQVSLATFGSELHNIVPPGGGPAHLKHILDTLEATPLEGPTEVAEPLHSMARMSSRRGLVVVISDLLDNQDEILNALDHFRHDRNEVLVFNVFDPAEIDFPFSGLVQFEDLETGEELQTRTDAIADEYRREIQEFITYYREQCLKRNIDFKLARTSTPFEVMLASYLERREKFRQ